MATLQSPYAAQPSRLPSATGGQDELEAFIQSLESANDAELPTATAPQPPSAQPADLGSVMSQSLGVPGEAVPIGGELANPGGNPPFPVQPEPDATSANLTPQGIRDQFNQAWDRFRASFAATDRERANFLTKIYGNENVRVHNGEFYFKRPGQEKFRKFDAETVEILGDFMDWGRGAVEEAMMLPFEVAGYGVGGPVGAVAGRGVGGPMGVAAGDLMGQVLGVERDPERDMMQEMGLAAGLNAVLGGIGDYAIGVGRRLFKPPFATDPSRVLLESSREFEQVSRQLVDSGIVKNLVLPDGTTSDTPFLLHQLDPGNPEARKLLHKLAGTKEMQAVLKEQGNNYAQSLRQIFAMAGRVPGDNPGLPVLDEVPNRIQNLYRELTKQESAALATYRGRATAAWGADMPMPNESQQLLSHMEVLRQKLKMDVRAVKKDDRIYQELVLPPTKDLQLDLGITGPAAKKLMERVKRVWEPIMNPRKAGDSYIAGLTIPELKVVTDDIDEAIRIVDKSRNLKGTYRKFSSELRRYQRTAIERGLFEAGDQEATTTFRNTMERLSNLLDGRENLVTVLENDSLTREAMVKDIFNSKKDALGKLNAVRSMLAEHPDTYFDFVQSWVDGLLDKSADTLSPTRYSNTKIMGEVEKLGRKFVDTVFEGTGHKYRDVMNLLSFGQRIEKTNMSGAPDATVERLVEQGAQALSGFKPATMRLAYTLFGLGREESDRIVEVATRKGIDSFLGRVPDTERSRVRRLMEGAIEFSRVRKNLTTSLRSMTRAGVIQSVTPPSESSAPVYSDDELRSIIDPFRIKPGGSK